MIFSVFPCQILQVALLKFTGYKIINNISDTGKAFLIILITDIFLGYNISTLSFRCTTNSMITLNWTRNHCNLQVPFRIRLADSVRSNCRALWTRGWSNCHYYFHLPCSGCHGCMCEALGMYFFRNKICKTLMSSMYGLCLVDYNILIL